MNIQEAWNSIGKEFKVIDFTSGLLARFDILREVTKDGILIGDFIEAPVFMCRLKNEQPEQLKKSDDNSYQFINNSQLSKDE